MARETWKKGRTYFLAIPVGKNVQYYMFRKDMQRFYNEIADELLKTHLASHMQRYKQAEKKLIETSEIDLNKDLAEQYKAFCNANDEMSFFYLSPWVVESHLDNLLKQKLVMEFGEEKAKRLYTAITLPRELIAFQEMQIEIKKLCRKYTQKDVEHLVKKWAWQGEYSLQEPPYDEKYFKEQLELAKGRENDAIEKISENWEKIKEVLQQLGGETKAIAEMVNEYITLRTHRVDALKKALYNTRTFFKHLAKLMAENGITYNDVINLTREEITNFLEKGVVPNVQEVKKRTAGQVAYLFHDGEVEFIPINKIQEDKPQQNQCKTKGVIANEGVMTGPVVIIKTKSDLLKIRTGCVMVAKTTYPEYTPFMRKAIAIVTEEGGITSHAAIVSRELGVPCIVGAKNATKIFTDNEVIIVNADKGTIEKV